LDPGAHGFYGDTFRSEVRVRGFFLSGSDVHSFYGNIFSRGFRGSDVHGFYGSIQSGIDRGKDDDNDNKLSKATTLKR